MLSLARLSVLSYYTNVFNLRIAWVGMPQTQVPRSIGYGVVVIRGSAVALAPLGGSIRWFPVLDSMNRELQTDATGNLCFNMPDGYRGYMAD